jgi:hypothetical protein
VKFFAHREKPQVASGASGVPECPRITTELSEEKFMLITRDLTFRGAKGQAELRALFDSGSTFSCITPEALSQIASPVALAEPLEVETANKGTFMRIESLAPLEFNLNGLRLFDDFMIVPNLSEEAIIGAVTMQKWRIKLDFEDDQVITDPRTTRLKLMSCR